MSLATRAGPVSGTYPTGWERSLEDDLLRRAAHRRDVVKLGLAPIKGRNDSREAVDGGDPLGGDRGRRGRDPPVHSGGEQLKLVLPASTVRRMVTVTRPPMEVWMTWIWPPEKLCEPGRPDK